MKEVELGLGRSCTVSEASELGGRISLNSKHMPRHLPRRTRLIRRAGRWRKAEKCSSKKEFFQGSGVQEKSKNLKLKKQKMHGKFF